MQKQTRAYLGAFLSFLFPGLGLIFSDNWSLRKKGLVICAILTPIDVLVTLVSIPLLFVGIGFITIWFSTIVNTYFAYYTYQKIMKEG